MKQLLRLLTALMLFFGLCHIVAVSTLNLTRSAHILVMVLIFVRAVLNKPESFGSFENDFHGQQMFYSNDILQKNQTGRRRRGKTISKRELSTVSMNLNREKIMNSD